MKNAIVVIDVNNLYFTLNKRYESRLNYSLYLEALKQQYNIHRAITYGAMNTAEAQKFVQVLRLIGYETNFVELLPEDKVQYIDWSMKVFADICRALERIDTVVIGSSEPKYIPMYEFLKERSVEVMVFACGIPRRVRETVNRFIEIEEGLCISTENKNEVAAPSE